MVFISTAVVHGGLSEQVHMGLVAVSDLSSSKLAIAYTVTVVTVNL